MLEAAELKKSANVLRVRPAGSAKSLIFSIFAALLKDVATCVNTHVFPLLSLDDDDDCDRDAALLLPLLLQALKLNSLEL